MKQMYIYFMTNQTNTTLYVGVTNNLMRRVWEHKHELIDGFTKRYKLHKLVYYEIWEGEIQAIQREKNIKHYSREWKNNLVNQMNPSWEDLYDFVLK